MPNAPPDAAVERFRSDLGALVTPAQAGACLGVGTNSRRGPRLRGGDDSDFGVAVSGGPDSLALLLLCASAFPGRTHAATVDHGLREESSEEAQFVGQVCADLRVPHTVLRPATSPHGNLSDWARRERYAALERWAEDGPIGSILTAHHADDQLETIIMRLNRGSGVAGLSAIRARQERIVRPLLGWRRSELHSIVVSAGLTAVDDPSNRDERFDRARLRKALAGIDWLDPLAAAKSAGALAQAEEALDWAATDCFARRATKDNQQVRLDPRDLPAELRRRLVLHCLTAVDPAITPRGADLQRLMTALNSGRTATLGKVRCTGSTIWLFAPAPPHRKN